jgi:hypothetical protein
MKIDIILLLCIFIVVNCDHTDQHDHQSTPLVTGIPIIAHLESNLWSYYTIQVESTVDLSIFLTNFIGGNKQNTNHEQQSKHPINIDSIGS